MTRRRTPPGVLGKKAGVVEDPRHFLVRDLLTIDVPMNWWEIAVLLEEKDGWPMFGNDQYGCCTRAAMGHGINAMEWTSGQRKTEPVRLTRQMVLDSYRHTGWRPEDPSSDQGDYLVDALKDWRANGIGKEADGTPHRISAYARVELPTTYLDSREFRVAARYFGGIYTGLALPESASDEINLDRRWEDTSDRPYSWGGHCVWLKRYDEHGLTCVTWGQEQRMTWAWAAKYLDEAWVVISEDIINAAGTTRQGLNVEALNAKLAAL